MTIRSQFDRLVDRVVDATHGQLSRQQRRSLERRQRKEPRPSLAPESLEARALLAVVVPGYEVTQDWGSGFQGSMTLENRDTEAVENWTVSFDYAADISSMWDAKVVSHEGDRYTVSNVGWNASLGSRGYIDVVHTSAMPADDLELLGLVHLFGPHVQTHAQHNAMHLRKQINLLLDTHTPRGQQVNLF